MGKISKGGLCEFPVLSAMGKSGSCPETFSELAYRLYNLDSIIKGVKDPVDRRYRKIFERQVIFFILAKCNRERIDMLYFKLAKWAAAWGTMMLCSWLGVTGFPTQAGAETPANTDAYDFSLNGLYFTIDRNTGGLVRLAMPGIGALLETSPDNASIIDMAYPVKEFEPLRLASRFSQNAMIDKSADGVIISWDALGASRSLDLSGKVSVSIQFRAAADGKSVIMNCSINNQSQHAIPQVLFPDFMGLLPFAGEDKTLFRTGTETIRPFEILKPHPETVPFYATGLFHVGNGWKEYKSGGYKIFSQKLVDWLDFGAIDRGFSLFARRWEPEDPQASIMLHRSEATGKLRLLFAHRTDIAPGAVWRSDDYWLTPRRHGWAEGIEPFREWVQQNMHRPYSMPEHIKKGMGFRTVWMAKGVTSD
ncbi:MAG: hypothetical protein GXO75_14760, partial [Calditrichaeota bacterium]|nr:hypothetical protein [Calditrichota bacterium]